MTTSMTRASRLSAVAGLALCGILLAGCTGGDGPSPEPSGSTTVSGSESPSAELKDRSAEVMADLPAPESVARTAAKAGTESGIQGTTMEIYSLTSTESSTVLTFALTGSGPGPRLSPGLWPRFPVLKTDTQVLPPVTWLKERGSNDPWFAVHNPTMWPKSDTLTPPQTILYPPLPEGTTSVTMTGTWFEDVTVPVTSR